LPKTTALASIFFTVTNELTYDQRMIRICGSLSAAGYKVTLVGVQKKGAPALVPQSFAQKRLPAIFTTGKLFYAEYNLRLFFYLLSKKMDGICAIDLDTIIPCYLVSALKKIPRIYDAHELFCEMKEIVSRPRIYKAWKWIERKTVPHFFHGYTVNQPIADEFKKMYGLEYAVVRSIAVYNPSQQMVEKEKFILYQGAVNEGRCFETLLPAMQWVNAPLVICGTGNFIEQARQITANLQLADKIIFKGSLPPSELREITNKAYVGLTLFEKGALSNYFSLANRFFDYIHSGVPQLCVKYPVYEEINNLHNIAVLIEEPDSPSIANALNALLGDEDKWKVLQNNCISAAGILNWQNEEKTLIAFYKNIFG
jgi:glycosyltransferase involved in cell wall biosynthesis